MCDLLLVDLPFQLFPADPHAGHHAENTAKSAHTAHLLHALQIIVEIELSLPDTGSHIS